MRTRAWVGYASTCLAATALLLLSQNASAATCDSAYSKMREIVNYSKTPDTLVLAHRGYWGKYNRDEPDTPENSSGSVYWANINCMDGVELDVKESADGVLYLMHDFNLGRTTDAYAVIGGYKYDPMTNRGTNPAVNSVNSQTIDRLKLLSPDRNTTTTYSVPRVSDILRTWVTNRYKIPLVFDVKTASAIRALDVLASGLGSSSNAVPEWGVKVNATLYPDPAAFYRDAHSLQSVIPVYTTNMLGVISVATSLEQWQRAVQTIEINVKQDNGLLSYQKDQALKAGMKVGVFHAIPDGPVANSFYKNTGECCYKLSDYYYTYRVMGNVAGQDTDDRRSDLQFLNSQGFGLITSDDPNHDVEVLTLLGKRKYHFQYYQ